MSQDRWSKKTSHILVILILGLTPLLWFGFSSGLIDVGDSGFPLDPLADLNRYSYAWDDRVSMGQDNSQLMPSLFPYRFLLALLQMTGLPLTAIQRIWFIIVFSLPGISMYYFISKILRSADWGGARLVTAMFYMLNIYVYEQWQMGHYNLLLAYGSIPFVLGLITNLFEDQGILRIGTAVSIPLVSMLFAAVASNPPTYLVTVVVVMLYTALALIANPRQLKKNLVAAALTIAVTLLINVWWILPYVSYLFSSLGLMGEFPISSSSQVISASSASSVLNLIRLQGDYIWYESFQGDPYVPFEKFYSNDPIMIIGAFLLPLLAFSALLSNRKYQKYSLFFGLLCIMGLFFSAGVHPPPGGIYKWMFKNIPGFFIFREPYTRFMQVSVLGYAVLVGLAVEQIFGLFNKKGIRKYFITGLTFLVLVNAWPVFVWANSDYYSKNKILPKSIISKIPDFYYQSSQEINSAVEDSKTLLLPQQYYYATRWGYSGQDILDRLVGKPIIHQKPDMGPFHSMQIHDLIYGAIDNSYGLSFWKILAIANVRQILQRNDVDTRYYSQTPPEEIRSFLSSQQGIVFSKTFGEHDLYRVDNQYFLPHIYAAIAPMFVNGSKENFFKLLMSDEFNVFTSVVLFSNDVSRNQRLLLEKYADKKTLEAPAITFKKINPTKYFVRVDKAAEPFFLVFSESYHPEWKAYIEDKSFMSGDVIAYYQNVNVKEVNHNMKFTPGDVLYLFKESVNDDEHFLANGYANAWYIDPKEIGEENFTITLYFRPQSYFYLGLFISGLTLIGCIVFLFWSWWKVKKQKAQIFNR
jgi:hypothetical protein